jgi:phage tail protein X
MPSLSYLEHRTVTGDRWDLLAAQYYGDATRYAPIVDANPEMPITPVLPSGRVLRIPILAADDADPADLPPWKR